MSLRIRQYNQFYIHTYITNFIYASGDCVRASVGGCRDLRIAGCMIRCIFCAVQLHIITFIAQRWIFRFIFLLSSVSGSESVFLSYYFVLFRQVFFAFGGVLTQR